MIVPVCNTFPENRFFKENPDGFIIFFRKKTAPFGVRRLHILILILFRKSFKNLFTSRFPSSVPIIFVDRFEVWAPLFFKKKRSIRTLKIYWVLLKYIYGLFYLLANSPWSLINPSSRCHSCDIHHFFNSIYLFRRFIINLFFKKPHFFLYTSINFPRPHFQSHLYLFFCHQI